MRANELDDPAPIATGPVTWRETDRPSPGEGQLLLEVIACGVCRSNLHMIEGDWVKDGVPAFTPIVPGHEVTGRVAEIGAGVDDFAVGDVVGVQPLWWTCEQCEYCASGRENLCPDRKITGEHVHGGYAEFMLSTAAHTYALPEGLDPIDAAPLFCPGVTAFGAVDKLDVGPGQTIAIFGLGGVGHMAVQFAALTGAEVVAVGRSEEHRRVALDLGADRAVDSTDPDALAALADTAHAVLNFAPSDEVTRQAMTTLRAGGTLVSATPVTLDSYPLFGKEQIVRGSVVGNREQMRRVLELAAEGKVRSVVERFTMPRAADALQRLADGSLGSRAVLWNESAEG